MLLRDGLTAVTNSTVPCPNMKLELPPAFPQILRQSLDVKGAKLLGAYCSLACDHRHGRREPFQLGTLQVKMNQIVHIDPRIGPNGQQIDLGHDPLSEILIIFFSLKMAAAMESERVTSELTRFRLSLGESAEATEPSGLEHDLYIMQWFSDVLDLAEPAAAAGQSEAVFELIFQGATQYCAFFNNYPGLGVSTVRKAIELLNCSHIHTQMRLTLLAFCRRIQEYPWAKPLWETLTDDSARNEIDVIKIHV